MSVEGGAAPAASESADAPVSAAPTSGPESSGEAGEGAKPRRRRRRGGARRRGAGDAEGESTPDAAAS